MIVARVLSFIGVAVIALFLPIWYFAPVALVYALVFSPYELLFIGIVIDAEFGDPARGVWFWYTLVAVFTFLVSFTLKPFLSFYKN